MVEIMDALRLFRRLDSPTYHVSPTQGDTVSVDGTAILVVWLVVGGAAVVMVVLTIIGFTIHFNKERAASRREMRRINWGRVLLGTFLVVTFLWIPVAIYHRTCGRHSRSLKAAGTRPGSYVQLQDPNSVTTWYGAPLPAVAAVQGQVPLTEYSANTKYDPGPHYSTAYAPHTVLASPPMYGAAVAAVAPTANPQHWQPHQPPPHDSSPATPATGYSSFGPGASPALQHSGPGQAYSGDSGPGQAYSGA